MSRASRSDTGVRRRIPRCDRLRLTAGPFRYELRAYDAWGRTNLARMRRHLDCEGFEGSPQWVIHMKLCNSRIYESVGPGGLPSSLAGLLDDSSAAGEWRHTDDGINCYWDNPGSREVLLTRVPQYAHVRARYNLPWQVLLDDATRLGGGIAHGGLAEFSGRAVLFIAPPGGGKTTALSRLPRTWRYMSDDAALVWPTSGAAYAASPLPTWSVLLGNADPVATKRVVMLALSRPLAGVFLLTKAEVERVSRLPVSEAARHVHRALSEFVPVLQNPSRDRRRALLNALRLARGLPCWRLELSIAGEFWRLVEDALSE